MTNKLIRWIPAVFLLLGLVPSPSAFGQGRDRGPDRVCFYQDSRFRGHEQCYYPGDEVVDLRGRNEISSIRTFGRARLIIYADSRFRGPSLEINSDVADLDQRRLSQSRSWNDGIGSFRIAAAFPSSTSNRGRDYDDQSGGRDAGVVCIFEHANFRGRSQCFDAADISELGRNGDWNDRISSLRVSGDAQVTLYEAVGFQGGRLVVDRDISDLAVIGLREGMNWNDRASSLQIREGRGRGNGVGNGRGRGRGPDFR